MNSEIERYILGPGQATSYKIGMRAIQGLRDEAKVALRDEFDYRAFHDTVLGGGSLPLPVLEARVRRWIKSRQAPERARNGRASGGSMGADDEVNS